MVPSRGSSRFSISHKIWILTFVAIIVSVQGQDPYMQAQINKLSGYVNTLNSTSVSNSRQIGGLDIRVTTTKNELMLELSRVSARVRDLEEILSRIAPLVETNQAAIMSAGSKIAEMNASLTSANGRILKLMSVHQIWQSNFRAVIKTFAALRKKIQFATPILQAIPANYLVVPSRSGR